MRLIWSILPLLSFSACKDDPATSEPEADPKVSYSLEIRPLLIESCLSCHGDLPLHNPEGWDVLHVHEEEFETPALLKKWVEQGRAVDPHWAGLPLRDIKGNSVDDFVEANSDLEQAREVPKVMFSAPVEDLLAGDLMPDQMRAISTGYLRQGEDTPAWRAEKVAREFLGLRIACAECHDHPSEPWSTKRYSKLADLFTTPYDHYPKVLPPLLVKVNKEDSQKLKVLKAALNKVTTKSPATDEDYLNWLALDEGSPSLPGLVAAYSFEGQRLNNLASLGAVTADGKDLIIENSAHGKGLFFNGQNELVLTQLPGSTELDRFTISAWIKVGPEALADTPIVTIGSRDRGFEFRIVGGRLQARWTRFWPQVAAVATSKLAMISPNRWAHVALSYDGTRQAAGMQIYLNGLPVDLKNSPTKLMKTVLPQGEALIISGKGLSLDELQIYSDVLTPIGVRQVFDGQSLMTAYQNGDDLRGFYQQHFETGEESRRQQVRALNEDLLKVENELPTYLVMAERSRKEGSEDSGNRLEFAQRLNTDLLARSLANEVWRRHFGSPLAHSLGFSDPLPSHPNLLEWLAGKLKKNNFNIAELGTLIRESKTWTQEWPRMEGAAAVCPRAAE